MKKKKKRKSAANLSSKKHLRGVKRREKERKRRAGFARFVLMLLRKSKEQNTLFTPPDYRFARAYRKLGQRPQYGDTIKFLLDKIDLFSPKAIPKGENGHLELPSNFSLTDNYGESMYFLKRLFYVLHHRNVEAVIIDYKNCQNLDLDASICMDLILACFINHFDKCTRRRHPLKIQEITPINFRDEISKFLFSIGAFRNIKKLKINYEDIITFDLRIGDKVKNNSGVKEVHETQIVDYVLECLKKMNRTLTQDAETNLSKVVGEIMTNAEEHANFRYRFAIGYFQESKVPNSPHIGVFKLVIFNFGQTIYESFIDSPNEKVIDQMRDISEEYTKKRFIVPAEFEEETLWTLYALQEGVTSKKDWKRGNGSIRFIESFFQLKGDIAQDHISKLCLMSGNTRILFDGQYPLVNVVKEVGKKPYKVMTFNESGDIHEKPDKKFVNFAPQFFPGTLISAKICITYKNIEEIQIENSERDDH